MIHETLPLQSETTLLIFIIRAWWYHVWCTEIINNYFQTLLNEYIPQKERKNRICLCGTPLHY